MHSTGHADLVELKDGRWYMVALGIRNDLEGTTNMGRETHLIPVTWETAVSGWKEGKDGSMETHRVLLACMCSTFGKS